jgi:hypothetical protein
MSYETRSPLHWTQDYTRHLARCSQAVFRIVEYTVGSFVFRCPHRRDERPDARAADLCVPKTPSVLNESDSENRITLAAVIALILLALKLLAAPFKSKSRLEAQNAALRHQLLVLQRKLNGPVQFTNADRLFFVESDARIRFFLLFALVDRDTGGFAVRVSSCLGCHLSS